jgi:CxxC motif-containing protein (DUF1111 family)
MEVMKMGEAKARKVQSSVLAIAFYASLFALATAGTVNAQKDPGPRPGTAAAGGPYKNLTPAEAAFFGQAASAFMEVDSVSGTVEDGNGLGPTFNGNSCAQCHAQPAMGGSSPGSKSPQNPVPNPQVALATLDGAQNVVPSFITADGPVREARFIRNSDGSPDGGVHGLFTISGRTDATGCSISQPNFAGNLAASNVIFRIPTPTFGLGLVESTPDAALQANLAANRSFKSALGIAGRFNMSGNDGTIARFGWKAQNKSLLMFAGEAYNVEQGVSNELFTNERQAVAGCIYNGAPEDNTPTGEGEGEAGNGSSDLVNFAMFMRFLAPPTPAPTNTSTRNGWETFNRVGCALCHTPTLTTGKGQYAATNYVTYHPYSDFAIHHMGSTLADGVAQGSAGADEFRTAPLWGLGQRLFFLHDGRTSDLLQAIQAHASTSGCTGNERFDRNHTQNCTSEANAVVRRFNGLSASQKQDLLNFLRSL